MTMGPDVLRAGEPPSPAPKLVRGTWAPNSVGSVAAGTEVFSSNSRSATAISPSSAEMRETLAGIRAASADSATARVSSPASGPALDPTAVSGRAQSFLRLLGAAVALGSGEFELDASASATAVSLEAVPLCVGNAGCGGCIATKDFGMRGKRGGGDGSIELDCRRA